MKRLLVVNSKYDGVEGQQREEEGERERKEGKGEVEKEGGGRRGVVTQFRPLLN